MKYRLFMILALMWCASAMDAQNVKELFVSIPDTILPTLTKNDRMDMVDLIENKMENEVTNRLKGKSRLTKLTDNLAKIQLSERSEVQLCKLPTPNSFLICMIHSVQADAWDSNVQFYNPDWTPASYHLSLSASGNFIMTFQHYDFIDDTTLKVSISDLKLSDSGEIALHQGRTVSIKWNTNQQKFVANEAQQ